jgi:membrane associated rhomboid family serine protease
VFPIRDHNPTTLRPIVNTLLIVANVAAFLWQVSMAQRGVVWVVPGYGVVPARVTVDPGGELFTVVTAMFLHGSWAHLGGNMWFLYIFGDNVEDAMGHVRYLGFYLLSGFTAAAAQILVDPASTMPMVGASGAIAGVLGAYMVLYPRAPVTVYFVLFFEFPAWIVVGEWFVFNLWQAFTSFGGEAQGGVAFFAHIGGFIMGMLLVRPAIRGRQRVPAQHWRGWRPPPKRPPPGQWS